MLTRRTFTGVAGCAICGLAEFVATGAAAQGAPAATTPGVTRKILSQTDGPTPGYTTILVEATIEAGVPVARPHIRGSNPPMSWKAASSFPSKVRRPAPSNQAMVF